MAPTKAVINPNWWMEEAIMKVNRTSRKRRVLRCHFLGRRRKEEEEEEEEEREKTVLLLLLLRWWRR